MYAESLVGAGGDSRGLRVCQHGVHQHGVSTRRPLLLNVCVSPRQLA